MALVVDDDGQEGGIDLEAAVIFDEAELLELVHEKVHAGPGGPDHFGECFLRYFRHLPSKATTASFPACERTETLMPPLRRYMTLSQGSPWEKTISLLA